MDAGMVQNVLTSLFAVGGFVYALGRFTMALKMYTEKLEDLIKDFKCFQEKHSTDVTDIKLHLRAHDEQIKTLFLNRREGGDLKK